MMKIPAKVITIGMMVVAGGTVVAVGLSTLPFSDGTFSSSHGKNSETLLLAEASVRSENRSAGQDSEKIEEGQVLGKSSLISWLEEEKKNARTSGNEEALERFSRSLEEARNNPPEAFIPQENDVVVWLPAFEENTYAQEFVDQLGRDGFGSPAMYRSDGLRDEKYVDSISLRQTRRIARGLEEAVWALCSPQSPFFRDPEVFRNVLATFEGLFFLQKDGDYLMGRGDRNMNRFIWSSLNDSYLMFTRTFPDLLPEVIRDYWERQIFAGAKHQKEVFDPGVYEWEALMDRWADQADESTRSNPHGPYWYPNIDAVFALQMHLAGTIILLNERKSEAHDEAERFIKAAELRARRLAQTPDTLFPDGGWTYMGFSNETISYHGIVLRYLSRYWQLSGSGYAKDALVRSAPYYPLSLESGGAGIDSNAPYWKHDWGLASWEPSVVAAIAECPFNQAVAIDILQRRGPTGNLRSASFFKPDIEAAELPDDFIVLDRNIDGPRGRFGRWAFTANGRDTRRDRGKYTYIGAMVAGGAEEKLPISGFSASLKSAFMEYMPEPDSRMHLTMGDQTGGTEVVESHIHERGTAFTVKTAFQRPRGGGGRSETMPWLQHQVWIMTEDRLVGYMEMYPESEQEAYGRAAVFRLGSGNLGRRGPSTWEESIYFDKHFEAHGLSDDTWSFDELKLRIVDHNFDRQTVQTGEDRAYRYLWNSPGWGDIRLEDAGEGQKRMYAPDDRRYVLVEIRPSWSSPSEGLEFRKNERGHYVLSLLGEDVKRTLFYDPESGRSMLEGAGEVVSPPPLYPHLLDELK